MGSLFDQCASRKNIEDDSIFLESQKDKDFCLKFPNACITNVTLPSGFKVPPKKYGLDWVVQGQKLILKNCSSHANLNSGYLFLIAPNDVGFAHHHNGKTCTGTTLPSGFEVPGRKEGRDWVFDGFAIVLK